MSVEDLEAVLNDLKLQKRKKYLLAEIEKYRTGMDSMVPDSPSGKSKYRTEDKDMSQETGKHEQVVIDAKYLRDLEHIGKLSPANIEVGGPFGEEALQMPNRQSVNGKQNFKSGRFATRSTNVVSQVQWPHLNALPRVYGKGEIKFDDLNQWELMEGELMILNDDNLPEFERKLRSKHLQELMLLAGIYPWKAILGYHGAVLEEIVHGRKNWSDSKFDIKERYLYTQLRTSTNTVSGEKRESRKTFCYDYQNDKCTRKNCRYKHICRPCLQVRDKIEDHSALRCPFNEPESRPKVAFEFSCKCCCLYTTFLLFSCTVLYVLVFAMSTIIYESQNVCLSNQTSEHDLKCKINGQELESSDRFIHTESDVTEQKELDSNLYSEPKIHSSCGNPCVLPYRTSWDDETYWVSNTWCCDGVSKLSETDNEMPTHTNIICTCDYSVDSPCHHCISSERASGCYTKESGNIIKFPSEYVNQPKITWPPEFSFDLGQVIELHDKIVRSGKYNFQCERVPVRNNLNIEFWRKELSDYSDQIICDYLEFGWPVGYSRESLPVTKPKNHKSAIDFYECVDKYVSTEVKVGSLAGPFQIEPFNVPLAFSPFQTVLKKGSNDRRIVCDLSFPFENSVNSGIPKNEYIGEPCEIIYLKVDDLVEIIVRKGKGCLMWKRDLKRAYRQLPVDPHDYHLLGHTWRNGAYVDLCIPFGLRTGSMAMQRTTNGFVYMLKKRGIECVGYIDDNAGANVPDMASHDFDTVFYPH